MTWLFCSQGSRGQEGQSGERFHRVFPFVFLLADQKTRPGGRGTHSSSQELADVTLRIQRQSRSIRVLLLSPHISLVAFLVAVAGSPMRLFLLPLFHSSGLCYFSSKYSNYFPYFYCFFSYFCYLSSSHYAFFFFIVSHPSRPHPQKRRIKETAVNKTCKRAVLSDDFHFIWAVPLNRWRKILF